MYLTIIVQCISPSLSVHCWLLWWLPTCDLVIRVLLAVCLWPFALSRPRFTGCMAYECLMSLLLLLRDANEYHNPLNIQLPPIHAITQLHSLQRLLLLRAGLHVYLCVDTCLLLAAMSAKSRSSASPPTLRSAATSLA